MTASGSVPVDTETPVVGRCEGCGACCREQGSPPGYLMIRHGEIVPRDPTAVSPDSPWSEDVRLFALLPLDARRSIDEWAKRIAATRRRIEAGSGEVPVDGPCIWLDLGTQRCRWYAHRPMICREFERGSEECVEWRDLYQIDLCGEPD